MMGSYFVIDTWRDDVRISEHVCWVRAGRAAAALDAACAASRGMKSNPNRYDVTDEDGVPLRHEIAA